MQARTLILYTGLHLSFPNLVNRLLLPIGVKWHSKNIVNQVSYSFKVTDSSGKVIADLKNQKAPDGTGKQTVKFDKEGPVTVLVSIDAVEGQPSGEFVEQAPFNVIVVGA